VYGRQAEPYELGGEGGVVVVAERGHGNRSGTVVRLLRYHAGAKSEGTGKRGGARRDLMLTHASGNAMTCHRPWQRPWRPFATRHHPASGPSVRPHKRDPAGVTRRCRDAIDGASGREWRAPTQVEPVRARW
jgi:hypothetical protein